MDSSQLSPEGAGIGQNKVDIPRYPTCEPRRASARERASSVVEVAGLCLSFPVAHERPMNEWVVTRRALLELERDRLRPCGAAARATAFDVAEGLDEIRWACGRDAHPELKVAHLRSRGGGGCTC